MNSANYRAGRPTVWTIRFWLGVLVCGCYALAPLIIQSAELTAVTNPFQPLSLAQAINIALQQNPNTLRARKDLEAAEGVSIQMRAIAIPTTTSLDAVHTQAGDFKVDELEVDVVLSEPLLSKNFQL